MIPLLFILPFFITIVLFYGFSKTNKPTVLATLFGLVHISLVIAMAVYINSYPSTLADLLWIFLVMIDMPISLCFISEGNFSVRTLALFGTLQYFIIGLGLGYLFNKMLKNKDKLTDSGKNWSHLF